MAKLKPLDPCACGESYTDLEAWKTHLAFQPPPKPCLTDEAWVVLRQQDYGGGAAVEKPKPKRKGR